MTGFYWGALFIWAIYWFTSMSFSWTPSLTGTLGGTAGGMAFLDVSVKVLNTSLLLFSSLISGISGAGLFSAQIKSCAA